MSQKQYEYFMSIIDKLKLPTETNLTEEARAIFEQGLDILLMYRGHPDTLMAALQAFMATGVRSYACAGIARILAFSAYDSNNKYDAKGVQEGLGWLEEAKRAAPYRFEIEVLTPSFYNMLGHLQTVRSLLDELRRRPEAKTSFRYALAEESYWDRMKDLAQTKNWNEEAFNRAQNDIQRLYVLNGLAGMYMGARQYPEALGYYHRVVEIDPNDPWAWHNLSWIYFNQGDHTNAGKCNERALNLMEFGAARDILGRLIQHWSKTRHPDVIADVPPYTIVQHGGHNREGNPFFKQLFGR